MHTELSGAQDVSKHESVKKTSTLFGMYQKEFRNKQGIYVYQPKIEGDKLLSEFYFGVWRDNQKDDHGVYLWLSENKDIAPFSNFDDASFDCFTGDIDNETFSH